MNNRGIVLLLGIIVVIVLSILAAVYFQRSIAESNSARREVSSTQAFWNAEAGLSQAVADLPTTIPIGDAASPFNVTVDAIAAGVNGSTIFRITSTGREFVSAAPITRTVEAVIQYFPFEGAGNFDNAIEVNNNLSIQGAAAQILPDLTYAQDYANVSFADKFKVSSSDIKALAISEGHYYDDSDPAYPVPSPLPDLGQISGPGQVTWIKISDPASYLQIPKNNWEGKGILIVEGNARVEGSTAPEGFSGIVWVTGQLDVRGNAFVNGTLISETSADVTAVAGTPVLQYNLTNINSALGLLGPLATRARLSWREKPE